MSETSEALPVVDGVSLEAEWAEVRDPRAAAVLCHPHPEYGGTMRSIVISTLFDALPVAGVTCVRFNFRGVGASSGSFGGGTGEQLDVEAVIGALDLRVPPETPLVLMGWSFGADVALSVTASRVAGWLAIAPPLRSGDPNAAGHDPRPKQLVLAEHDEIREPDEIRALTADWTATTVDVVGGASHFFVGRTDQVATAATEFVTRV